MDDKARYEVFKARQGRCHYCGTRLKWEAFEIRGLSGGWVIEEQQDGSKQALCYKCFEFPQRGKTAHRLTISEEQRSTAAAMGMETPAESAQVTESAPVAEPAQAPVQEAEPAQASEPVQESDPAQAPENPELPKEE